MTLSVPMAKGGHIMRAVGGGPARTRGAGEAHYESPHLGLAQLPPQIKQVTLCTTQV